MPPARPEIFSLTIFVSSLIGLLFGFLSAVLIEAFKHHQEKQRLINLFIEEIRRTFLELDSKKSVPIGPGQARAKSELFGISGVTFSGTPEYQLEVYNVKLFETEGVRMAQQLGTTARKRFWVAYGRLRDAEAIRLVIKGMPKEEHDYEPYQKVFVGLVLEASKAMERLEKALNDERSFIETLREVTAKV